ncbi:hypothetical protein [Pseudogemmobacter humi]|uniref:Uncharacterized protein n=1 Tax=Pseudogemmobacter humi TaxID=2483812 RepID=A0A3P5XT69_9RHOB|nr:hypothetical protein [Pseudogemmobacter humi]VDC34022.1 hypothetical protein XINFAN_04220 [Pseudogemmobacter humi]
MMFAVAAAASLTPQRAEAYPIDCAILLCLAGGWPASAECSRARAEFVRRITPWPVEPPLQIWRCPMHTTAGLDDALGGTQGAMTRLVAAISRANPQQGLEQSVPEVAPAVLHAVDREALLGAILHQVQVEGDAADIDISGPEFDFVRSIRVWHVVASQHQGRDDCIHSDGTRLGQYTTQGQYHWQRSHVGTLPPAFGHNPTGWCSSYRYRAVFVDWRDHEGNYGYERVDY